MAGNMVSVVPCEEDRRRPDVDLSADRQLAAVVPALAKTGSSLRAICVRLSANLRSEGFNHSFVE